MEQTPPQSRTLEPEVYTAVPKARDVGRVVLFSETTLVHSCVSNEYTQVAPSRFDDGSARLGGERRVGREPASARAPLPLREILPLLGQTAQPQQQRAAGHRENPTGKSPFGHHVLQKATTPSKRHPGWQERPTEVQLEMLEIDACPALPRHRNSPIPPNSIQTVDETMQPAAPILLPGISLFRLTGNSLDHWALAWALACPLSSKISAKIVI